MSKFSVLDFLNGYETVKKGDGAHRSVGKRFFARSISGNITQKTRRFLNTGPVKMAKSIADRFAYSSAQTYGAMFLTFGLLSIIFHFIKEYTPMFGDSSMWSLLIGLIFSIVSIPLLLVDEPVAVMLEKIHLTDIIFFEFFSIKRLYYTSNEKTLPIAVSILFGIALAIVGLFVPAFWIAAFVGAVVFISTAFASPEFSFFSSLLVLPYVSLFKYSTELFAILVLLTALSFVRKALFGKRVVHLEQYDLLILVMAVAFLISGIFSGGKSSFFTALIGLVMLMGYFLASNTLTNRRLTDCSLIAVVISSLPVSIIYIVDFIIAAAKGNVQAFIINEYSAVFANAESAAVFLIVSSMFALTLANDSHGKAKFIYSAFAAISIFSLAISGELLAILAMFLAYIAYILLKSRSIFALTFFLAYLLNRVVCNLKAETGFTEGNNVTVLDEGLFLNGFTVDLKYCFGKQVVYIPTVDSSCYNGVGTCNCIVRKHNVAGFTSADRGFPHIKGIAVAA